MTVPAVVNSAGRRRSPATLPGYHAGRPPRNKGQLFPADPPTVEEIVAVMRLTGEHRHGWRRDSEAGLPPPPAIPSPTRNSTRVEGGETLTAFVWPSRPPSASRPSGWS